MKIGIVTQPLQGNYGGILQNYALQQVLLRLGHEPVTLDFQSGKFGYMYFRYTVGRLVGRLRGMKIRVFLSPYFKRRHPQIKQFVDEHIVLSRPFHGRYPANIIKQYGLQALIVGSDQTWRPRYNSDVLNDMFLEFANGEDICRIAYAASFGTSDWEYTTDQAAQCTELLKDFDAVSVRESSAIDLVARLGSKATVVLDPTLLLGRDGFESIVRPYHAKPKDNYLAAYILDSSEETSQCLETVANALGLKSVLHFHAGESGMGPGEWIDAIRSGRFFISDSFHGTVFAILNHIPFLTLVNIARGGDRFHSLLTPLGLDYALITDISEVTPDKLSSLTFDWESLETKLDSLRESSLAFLKSSLV